MAWQYDSYSQTCNKFSSYFGDIITPQADASPAQKILLAGSRSCSSDFFKPQLESCNGQINTRHRGEGYRYFTEFNTVALCARACSIDPMCVSWGVFNGQSDCTLSQNDYDNLATGSSAAGSRNCGVP
ncbi:hypothetical protein FCULG_00011124 [Fusarium culmorum]|uniref:Apple domain-containing protein n=1 Tax=Fusarium culmorum TaxID=5516 RepID=A0A2T4GYT5_FUSCU|nr:hypothetical protein FCULG_00011124 [Fusarium culmorum]